MGTNKLNKNGHRLPGERGERNQFRLYDILIFMNKRQNRISLLLHYLRIFENNVYLKLNLMCINKTLKSKMHIEKYLLVDYWLLELYAMLMQKCI